jgi:hypothetical protein
MLSCTQQGGPLVVNVARLFAGIPYVVGGVATLSYMPERLTKDIYVLVPAPSYEETDARLRQGGWQATGQLRFPDSSLNVHGSL